jgi:UDP-N-acetyl-D-mannosaminuronate dehydrogenase
VIEPNIKKLPNSLKESDLIKSVEVASKKCDVALLLVNHKEFKSSLKSLLVKHIIIDACGLLDYNQT